MYYDMHFHMHWTKKTILTDLILLCVHACVHAVYMCACKLIASDLHWFWLSQFKHVWRESSIVDEWRDALVIVLDIMLNQYA